MLMTCPKCGKLVQGKEGDQCPDCKIFLRPTNGIQARDEEDSPEVSGPYVAEPPVAAKIVKTGEAGIGKRWIAFLRGLLWGVCVLICCLVFAYAFRPLGRAVLYIYGGFREYAVDAFVTGIVILLVGVLVAFIILAAGMVALDVAENIRRSTNNTSHILEILDRQGKR